MESNLKPYKIQCVSGMTGEIWKQRLNHQESDPEVAFLIYHL